MSAAFVSSPEAYELPEQILGFIAAEAAAGRACALTVVTDLSGGSMREIGSLAAVSESGVMAGYVSNGCIDADLARQALSALAEGRPRALRYGAGSPFVDLQLPCGGSVDVMIVPRPDPAVLQAARTALEARRAVCLGVDETQGLTLAEAPGPFAFRYTPALRLIVAGKGPTLAAMVRHARASEIPVAFASPVVEEHAALLGLGAEQAFEMALPWDPVAFTADPWTAVVLLFHDHVWETQILRTALGTEAFYIGCLGSDRTQASRRLMLEGEGLTPAQIDRVLGPIGMIPSSRGANELAISVLADVRRLHKRGQRGQDRLAQFPPPRIARTG